MFYLSKLALRNLRRHKLRTAISILAISVVVMIVVFSRGLVSGTYERSASLYVDNNLGHVRIINEEYQHRELLLSLDYTIDGFQGQGSSSMVSELKDLEEVEHLLPRLKFGAMASIEDRMVRMMGLGVDPDAEEGYGYLLEDIVSGRMVESGNEIVAGSGLLEKLKAEEGDRVTVVFSDAFQSIQGRTLEVVGVRETGVSMLDDNFFFLPLETAQDMLHLMDEVTEMMVFTSDLRRADELEENLVNLFSERGEEERYSILTWKRADPLVALFDEMMIIMDLIYVFFILLGAIVVISTLIMIIRERISEIGMMGALGLKSGEIMKIYTMEGALMGTIGSLLGVVGGGILTYYLSLEGLQVEVFADMIGGMDVLFEPVLHIVFSLENLLISFIMGSIITALACLYPAWRASRMDPVDALRTDA